mgnify:FL=1
MYILKTQGPTQSWRFWTIGVNIIRGHGPIGTKDHAWRYRIQLIEDFFPDYPIIAQWLRDSKIPYNYMNSGVEFLNEEDASAFMLRWNVTTDQVQ